MMRHMLAVLGLYLGVLFTALGLVYSKHLQRQYFIELQSLETTGDQLRTDWERLQLEDSTWSNHARVEQIASNKLKMKSVSSKDLVMLKLK